MTVLGNLMEEGHIADAVLCQSTQQANQLWEMRDDVEALALHLMPLAVFDVSLPIREMESYVADLEAALKAKYPDIGIISNGMRPGFSRRCFSPRGM